VNKSEADGLSWQEAGSGSPILLIHGSGFDGSTWGSFYDELAHHHRVISYNRRGYRDSGRPARKWRTHADDVERLLRSRDAVPATIVGHSAGAIVATELAHRLPEIVASLVLFDPAVYLRRNLTVDFAWTFVAAHAVRRLRGDQPGAERFYRWATS
jgi:pimeloyl-ACP methyl ester carboxylesterase